MKSGFEPWPWDCVVFLGKTLSVIVPLSTHVYKWVPANLLLGKPCDGLACHLVVSRNMSGAIKKQGCGKQGSPAKSGPVDFATKNSFPLFFSVKRVWSIYIKH